MKSSSTCALIPLLALGLLAGGCSRAGLKSKGPEPREISMGEPVNLADYVVPGKITIFDFFSRYCPPCMAEAPLVKKLHETRADVAVVEVNINRPGIVGIDWQSPVIKEFQLDSIPHFKVYDQKGKLMAEGDDARLMVDSWEQSSSSGS